MNIDKFGHHVHKRLRLSNLIDDLHDTLVKSETGHYDLKSAKLKGLTSPTENDEAVNKAYTDNIVEELRNEIKKVSDDVKVYIKNLEVVIAVRLSKMFYTKSEIDNIIEAKLNKNE